MFSSKAEEGDMFTSVKDWKKAVRTPSSYRVGKNVNKLPTQVIIGLAVACVLLIYFMYSSDSEDDNTHAPKFSSYVESKDYLAHRWKYNNSYPLSRPSHIHDSIHFKVGLVTDLDHSSRSKLESNTWVSYYLQGTLIWNPTSQTVSATFDKNNFITLKTKFSHNGRGMELSELVTFNGKIYTFDDRSGMVYEIDGSKAYPWIILTAEKSDKGYKSEWATVKNEHLYVGSMGKEWTSPLGEFINNDPMHIKKISPTGEVEDVDWVDNYKALRRQLGIEFPGYMLHESGTWSDVHKKWFFLPRRMSHESYNEEKDETQGTNVLLIADENFKNIEVKYIGEVIPAHGFSTFKFIPGTNDEVIVALKTKELEGQVATFLMAFTINGKIILGETKIDDSKYEGFEFI